MSELVVANLKVTPDYHQGLKYASGTSSVERAEKKKEDESPLDVLLEAILS